MQRGFIPGGGFGGGFGRPFFRPFPHPFFPGRFLFPFFFFSPFYFPFVREEQAEEAVFARHQAQAGDTLTSIGHKYNIPYSILEEANPHLQNPAQLGAGEVVSIPRISNMVCQKHYLEVPGSVAQAPQAAYSGQAAQSKS
ncbi:LysM peptidoglycan-binding domain-containing protein [Cohnella fermenti]|uniref:LysM peptidoglycan-binding domain-containing protein n=1 Tax=Cohnella fermenti TaxID=2565925 RepID=A0A4S4BEL5_9BACL|nr:LysM domain-containing protein [Cohnella fermenti]THF72622.1 LysM peptidoglycan-binding domain-containing protein [Cohnella fermenti]